MLLEVRLFPQQDYNTSLREIVDKFNREIWRLPEHQRGQVWQPPKRKGWVKRICSPNLPVGVIVTYEIDDGKHSHTWVNDGAQRIQATAEFLSNPENFGYNKAEAEDAVDKCLMPVQHRHYKSHDEAFLDFQRLNQGTSLTSLEFYRGVLTYMDSYKTQWKPLLDNLGSIMLQCSARVVGGRTGSRPQIHKLSRHDYVLAYRFLSDDKSAQRFEVGKSDISNEKLERKDVIECHLRDILESLGTEVARQEFDKLYRTIERETALIESLWIKVQKSESIGRGLTSNLFRFILEASIWKRNNGIPNDAWSNFVEKLLINTKGRGAIIDPDDPSGKRGLALGRLENIKVACDFIGSNLCSFIESKSKRDKSLKPGYDQSHFLPQSSGVESSTFPEPAGPNRARGAKPVQAENLPLGIGP